MEAIPKSARLHEAHLNGITNANAWHGRCVNQFAVGELAIGQALMSLPEAKTLPMLLSQKVSHLTTLAAGAKKKLAALDAFKDWLPLRNAIVHGSGKVYVDGEGHWLLVLHTTDRAGRHEITLSQVKAEEQLLELKKVVQRLGSALRT